MALNDQMDAVFKSSRTDLDSVPDNTVGIDPESGNEVPLGSMPEEVRDDIPAQLSEGEYVVPADVVRYYGVKFFENLRAEAKFGYQDMNENGRIGGEPMGMETVEPEDDMMFDISELEVVEGDDEPMKMDQGGYALAPGDEGYDEMGALGLGAEGIPLGTGEPADGAVEMVAYVNDEGRVIYIMHINGVPQNEIPYGFYPRTEEESTETADATGAQPAPQVVVQGSSDDGDRGGPQMEPPKAIDYQNLTLDEMQELMDDMNSKTTKAVTAGVIAMSGPVGLLLKGAMMHQERQLRKEMERRLDGELTTQDRARLEGMIQEVENKKGGIFGALKGKAADLIIGEEQGPGMDIQPPKTYSPEVAAGTVTKPLSPEIMSEIDQAAKDAGDAVREQQAERARQRKAEKEAAAAAAAQPQPPISDGSYADDTGYSAAGTGDVLTAMRDRGASEAAITAAEDEAARIKSNLESTAKGGKMGFKKGGLASKRGKKKK